ncbi:MAG: hypothetical protein JW881_06600 [Spirochaetales bacterium]|nr:hypothetical protein [Spirochaetales bacterium]
MLVGARNNILLSGILVSLVCMIGFVLILAGLLSGEYHIDDTTFNTYQYWWFMYEGVHQNNYHYVFVIIGLSLLLVFSFSMSIIFRSLFKRIASAEVFFFSLFICSLSIESLRLLSLFFHLVWNFNLTGLITSRIVYFGRFFGLLCFFFSSLYSIEVKYQKYGNLLGGAVILSIIIAYIVPFDTSEFLSTFLYKLGDESGVCMIYSGLSIIIVINFIVATIIRQKRFLGIVVASLLILAGYTALLFISGPLPLVLEFLALLGGTILFYVQMGKIYFWY